MKKFERITLVVAMVFFMTAHAHANYIDFPIKWSQAPSDDGLGSVYLSDLGMGSIVADDFQCDSPDPIAAVRWWGSYIGETEIRDDESTGPFTISFYNSMAGPKQVDYPEGHPYSSPIVQYEVYAQEEAGGATTSQGEPVYRYDAYLPQLFDQAWYASQSQVEGDLWIAIDKPTGENWGWLESGELHPILSYAKESSDYTNAIWENVGDNTDMAFELMAPVPIPGAIWLLSSGLLGLLGLTRKYGKH